MYFYHVFAYHPLISHLQVEVNLHILSFYKSLNHHFTYSCHLNIAQIGSAKELADELTKISNALSSPSDDWEEHVAAVSYMER